jgi:hypothetical protein
MKFLKGLAVTIVGFLLFLSLSAWSTAFMLKQTLANPDFVVAEINKLDTAKLGKEMIGDQIKEQLPTDLNLSGAIDEIFDEMAPWFKQEMNAVTYTIFDYLGGKTRHLSVDISLEPVKTTAENKIRQALVQSPPPEIAALPAAQQPQLIDQYVQQYVSQVPDNFSFTENSFPAQYHGIISYLKWAVTNLNLIFWGLIGLMVLWVLCLFALYRDVKGFSRSLASPLLSVGVLGFAGTWVTEHLILPQAGTSGLPPELGRWTTQFMVDVGAKMNVLYISLGVAGIILFLLSIFWRRKESKNSE